MNDVHPPFFHKLTSKCVAILAILLLLNPNLAFAQDKTSDLANKGLKQVQSQLLDKTLSAKKLRMEITRIDSSIAGLMKLFDPDQDALYQEYLKKIEAEKAARKARPPAKGLKAKAKRAIENMAPYKTKKVKRPTGHMRAKSTKETIRNTIAFLRRQRARFTRQLLLVQLASGLTAIKQSKDKTQTVTSCVELQKLLTAALKARPKDKKFLLDQQALVSSMLKKQME